MAGAKKTKKAETAGAAGTDKAKEQWEQDWEARVGAFATAVGLTLENVNTALEKIAGKPGQVALDVLANEGYSPFEDIRGCFATVPVGVLRANVALLRGSKEEKPQPTVVETTAGATGPLTGPSLDVLPSVPDDDSFTAMLKIGGELKVGKTEVISAMKASLAERVGLFKLPEILKQRMEEFAEQNEEPCVDNFFKLRNMVIKRRYSEVLGVLGIEGSFMSQKRIDDFNAKVDRYLWDALADFQNQLSAWQDAWMKGAANPAAMFAGIAAMLSGGGAMPPGMMAPPETAGLRDAAGSVVDKINRIFAGVGIPVARARAYDAQKIREVLNERDLPASVGAANKEQMLKMLKTNVTADYVRMERNITRYALGIMELPNVGGGNAELAYIGALLQLGISIPWDKLLATGKKAKDDDVGFTRF